MLTNKTTSKIFIKLLVSFSCLFVFVISAKTALGNQPKVSLSPQEQAWLKDHPEIRLGFNPHMEPLLIRGEDGSYAGIYPKIINELEEVLGVNINIEVDDWNPIVQKARNREIDGLLACAPSQAEASSLLRTQPLHQGYPVAFTLQNAPFTITRLEDLKGKSIAYQREVKMLEVVLNQLEDDSKIIAVNSTLQAMSLVLESKVDVAFGVNFENYLVTKHALSGIKLTYLDLEHANPISTCIRNDWPEFIEIFNKGLQYIGRARIQHILAEWTNIKEKAQMLGLTPADHAWLDAHPVISVGADSAWEPIEFLNKDGKYSGLSIDYLKKIEPMLGVRFEFIQESWQELIARAKQGQLDMFSCVAKTSERDKYLLFTEPYVEMPAGIFTRDDAAYIANLSVIADEKVAVVEGYAIHDFLVANYPDMNLILVKTPEEGINKLIKKEAFAFIDNSITTGHLISHKGYLQIKLSGEALFVYAQSMAVRKDWPQLRSILQQAIDTIPESERHALYMKWVPSTYEKPADYSLIWKIGAGCFLVVFLFFFWNRKLTAEVQKRTKALLQSEEKYKAISEDMPVLVCRFSPSGEITYVNDAYCMYFKKDTSELIGRNILTLIAEKDRDRIWNNITSLTIETPTQTHEHRVMSSEADTQWQRWTNRALFNDQGEVVAYQAIGEDITASKQAERELRLSAERFERWKSSNFIGIIHSTAKGDVIDANDTMLAMLGYSKQDLTEGKLDWTQLTPPEFLHLDNKAMDEAAEKGAWTPFEKEYFHKDGHRVPILIGGSVFKEAHDEYIVFIIDLTERKTIEAEKQNLENRLGQAQKMEAIGTLAGGIAHDFNNILGVILGYTDLAKEDAPPGTLFEKDLDQVLIAANRAKDLVKQILAFSRQAQVERIPIKIQPLIKEGLKMLRSSIPTTISITEDIDPASGTILADPTQIHQILMNLCTNAYQAMDDTGGVLSVTVKTTFIETDEQEMLLHLSPGEYIELTVSDTGRGIGPDVIDKVFDPYFTTKEIGEGTGMGLAIIHGIIADYGGTITVESELGKGSTFHVYIPVFAEEVALEINDSKEIPKGKERVLFIDDEEILAEMGKNMLERLGYHVTVRCSSTEALITFQNTPNEFDIVITDQTMPDMTGSDLARRMMQIRPDVPIILCTGYSNLIDEHSVKVLGIKEFALKPLSKGLIAKLIRKVLDD